MVSVITSSALLVPPGIIFVAFWSTKVNPDVVDIGKLNDAGVPIILTSVIFIVVVPDVALRVSIVLADGLTSGAKLIVPLLVRLPKKTSCISLLFTNRFNVASFPTVKSC